MNANPYQSKVLFPAKYRELDFKTIDKLCKINKDFEKFIEGLSDVIGYIQQHNGDVSAKPAGNNDADDNDASDSGDIKLTIDF